MKLFNKKRIFLDYASITPVDKRVSERMQEVSDATFANPSALYKEALVAKGLVLEAREKIARILNVRKSEIVFTSGGTESNNLALLGVFEDQLGGRTSKLHIVTTVIEHPAILEVCKEIERRGGEVTYLPVSNEGLLSLKDIREAIKPNTVLVTIGYANNEIGTIQPIHDIGRVIKDWRQKNNAVLPYFHTDACQGASLTLDVQKLGVDLLTLDGIKLYGPRGIGILYVKNAVNIKPIIFGGGQEKGLRSGTENVPAIVSIALALEICSKSREKESSRLLLVRDYAIEKILKTFPTATLNGSKEFRLPNNINICFPRLDAEFAVVSLDVLGISASYSSSCRTLKEDSSSYVVESLGKKDCSSSSLRFTLGRGSKKSDIDRLIVALKKIVL